MTDHLCPLVASLDVADRMISEYEDVHENPAISRGHVALSRRCLEMLREAYPCDGSIRNDQGDEHCPLAWAYGDTMGFALVRNNHPLMVDPDKVIPGREDKPTGLFL